jgi:putative aldouronate transport system substrate-binding protein
MYPVTLNENIKYHEFQDAGYSGGWGVAITTKCKDSERAMKFLDWMSGEEAQVLIHWGIEGVHYKYENNKRVLLPQVAEQMRIDPQFKKKTGISNYTYPFPEYGNTVNDSTGNCYQTNTVEKVINDYTNVEKEVLATYGVKMWKELYPQKNEFPVKPWGYAFLINMSDPEMMAIGTKCQEIGKKRIPEAILAKPEKFDEVWDKYMKELDDAGRIKYEDALSKLIQERLEMWK